MLKALFMCRFAWLLLLVLVPDTALAQDLPVTSELGDPVLLDPELVPYSPPRVDSEPAAGRGSWVVIAMGASLSGAGATTLAIGGAFLSGSDGAIAIAGSVLLGLGIPVLFGGIYWLLERVDGAASVRGRVSNPLLIRF